MHFLHMFTFVKVCFVHGGRGGRVAGYWSLTAEVQGSKPTLGRNFSTEEIANFTNFRELRGCFKQFATKIRWISREE